MTSLDSTSVKMLHKTQKPQGTDHWTNGMPSWLRRSLGKASEISRVQQVIRQRQIYTICEEGRCPNRGECYAQQTATFLLMGPTCTRACGFCQVDKGHAPPALDPHEPQKVAEAVSLLGLRYVVLTSVARDDLLDQGASQFATTIIWKPLGGYKIP